MSNIPDLTREAIMNSYRDGSMNELLTDDDCREIFIGILKGGSDITKGLLYELLREYESSPDLVIIEAPFQHPVEIAHAVIGRMISATQFNSKHEKVVKINGKQETLTLAYHPSINCISVLRGGHKKPIASLVITPVIFEDPIKTQSLIDSHYTSLISQLHSFQLMSA